MLTTPMDILTAFPVRKSKNQKAAFRREVTDLVKTWGYEAREEKGGSARNLVIGDPAKAAYLVTAHYDTCAWMPVPNLLTPVDPLPFFAYQLAVAIGLLLLCVLPSILIWQLTKSVEITYLSWYLFFLVMACLLLRGPANKHNVNDNTSGVVTALEIARDLPQESRDKVCFVLFDLEEAGLLGSSAYQKAHKKETGDQLVLNLDCVGDGDEILLFPNKKMKKKKPALYEKLAQAEGTRGEKTIRVVRKGFSIYPSDQKNLPNGVGIAAFIRGRRWLYLDKIHTHKDTVLDRDNVAFIKESLLGLLGDHTIS